MHGTANIISVTFDSSRVEKSEALDYTPPPFLFNAHLETIFPALFRRVTVPARLESERIETPDDDFLDLHWYKQKADDAVVISHGLEGNAERAYIKGMARACYLSGFDVVTWNYRGCGPEMNRVLRFYHSGATDDLDLIVRHVSSRSYKNVYLVGFSLGGNLTLKYLGEDHDSLRAVKGAVALSVPLDLSGSCRKISMPSNRIYSRRFLKSLKSKIIRKSAHLGGFDLEKLKKIETLVEFDDVFTAPLHGFEHAEDYYARCSALGFISRIEKPTLLINARNDPFLSEACYPDASAFDQITVLYPLRGGHVGFTQFGKNGLYWSEERVVDFLTRHRTDIHVNTN